ncbi:MAG TPA: glycerophosphodiester phosphodiesterase family protein, partial [Clostridia bacterium]|nr:glycerophosphodiester phosphodiesterase family protein [Clostridia bacterium]
LAAKPGEAAETALALGAFGLNLQYRLITPDLVTRAHRNFLWVWAWTVNERSEADQLCTLGVNGITTRGFSAE